MNEPATPGLVGSSEGLGLRPERSDVLAQLRLRILREHGGLGDGWRDHWNLTPGDSLMHREAVAEIERLRAVVKAANDQAERFERGWYLRGDVLEKLQSWANAYPLAVFPEPDVAKAHELLQAGGMTLDAISASNMRHVISGVRALVEEGLKA